MGEGIEELAARSADRAAFLLGLREEAHRFELLHRFPGDRPRTASRMIRGRAVVPAAAELGGEAGRTDGPLQLDLAQDGGDPAVPPVLLDPRLFPVEPRAWYPPFIPRPFPSRIASRTMRAAWPRPRWAGSVYIERRYAASVPFQFGRGCTCMIQTQPLATG